MDKENGKEEKPSHLKTIVALALIIMVVAYFSAPAGEWWDSVEKQTHEWLRQWRYHMTGLP